jgi:hypothetical protein
METFFFTERSKKYDNFDGILVLFVGMESNRQDKRLDVQVLWKHFLPEHCPTLTGKPKIFLIQTNYDEMTDPGMIFKPTPPSNTVHSPARVQRPETGTFSKIINWFRCHKNQSNEPQDPSDLFWIPSYADFVIMYSMFDQKCGLIQTFLDLLRVNPHKNLMKILTDVNRQMMQSVPKMPCIMSTLTKTLFFSKNALRGTRRKTKTEALSCFYEIQGSRLRGTSIIFNQVNCRGYAEPRVGSDKDAVALYAAHGALGLDIEPCDDYTSQEIREKLLDGKFTDCNFTRASISIFFFYQYRREVTLITIVCLCHS